MLEKADAEQEGSEKEGCWTTNAGQVGCITEWV